MAKLHKNDFVEVITGNDKGKRGRVLRVIPDKQRIVVEGVNLRWRHMRKSQQLPQGGRIRKEMPIQVSNVMIYDEGAELRTRVSYRIEKGKKIRVGRKTGTEIGVASEKKATAKAKGRAKDKDKTKKDKE